MSTRDCSDHVYVGDQFVIDLLEERREHAIALHAAADAWNEANPGWKVAVMTGMHRDLYISAPEDLRPDGYWHRNLSDEERQRIKDEMDPYRKGLTKAGAPYKDKRGDLWRERLASLPGGKAFGKRFDALGLGIYITNYEDEPNFVRAPNIEILDGRCWITTKGSPLEGRDPEHITEASWSDYYRAKADQIEAAS